jgi:MraZ protein
MAFLGSVEYQMDDRNRVAIPPRYRDQFDAPAVMTTSKDACVSVYTQDGFDQAAVLIEAIPEDTAEGRRARRFFFGNAYPVAKDGQGRLLLPPKLIEHAGLKKDVVVVGLGRWFEIWDKTAWDERVSGLDGEEE